MKPDQPSFKPDTLFLGSVLGFAIWIILSHFSAGREPWDSNAGAYVLALFLAGFFFGRAEPAFWKKGVIGLYLGQLAGILLKSGRELGLLIPMGLIALALFTACAAAGAIIGKSSRR